MTMAMNRVPPKERPILRLKFSSASTPEPEPKSEPISAKVIITEVAAPPPAPVIPTPASRHLNEFEIAGRARAAAIAERRAAVAAMRRALIKRWPNCFKGFKRPKLPLAIGIDKAIFAVAPELDPEAVKNAISRYASEATYHAAMIEGAVRVDLDGNPAGVVTEKEARWAATLLKRKDRS
jgi:hypothetical protein